MATGYVFADLTLQEIWGEWRSLLLTYPDWTVHLFDADHTPADGDDELAFNECSFNGYAPQSIINTNWGAVALVGHFAEIVYAPNPHWDFAPGASAPVTIYGFYLMDDTARFRYAERVAAPKVIDQGDALELVVRLRERTCR